MRSTSKYSNDTTFPYFVAIAGAVTCAISAAAYFTWRYFTSRTQEQISEVPLQDVAPEPSAILREKSSPGVQCAAEGTGPFYHRKYQIRIQAPRMNAGQLMDEVRANLNACSPLLLARFEKTKSISSNLEPCSQDGKSRKHATLNVGDEFQIHITGPWNGPVKVAESTDDSFTFVTKEGHFEAGGIRFRAFPTAKEISNQTDADAPARPASSPHLIFEIESWSRSSDGLVDFVYDKIPAARLAQTQMWTQFCEGAAKLSGGDPSGRVKIITERSIP